MRNPATHPKTGDLCESPYGGFITVQVGEQIKLFEVTYTKGSTLIETVDPDKFAELVRRRGYVVAHIEK